MHTATGGVLQHAALDGIMMTTGLVFQNALTLASTGVSIHSPIMATAVHMA